ncbi:hypothetical protein GC173_02730 [bacterium]|nr:hypothetical protein [bacterium]
MKGLEKRIAARMLSAGAVTEQQLQEAIAVYTGEEPIQRLLARRGVVSMRDACRFEAEASGLQFIELDSVVSQPAALEAVSAAQAWQHQMLPIWRDETSLTLAMIDVSNIVLIDDLRLRLNLSIVTVVAEAEDLRRALVRYYGPNPAERAPRSSREVAKLVAPDQPIGDSDSVPTQPLGPPSTRDVNSTKTQLDLPKLNVNSIVEDLRRKSGSGEISHREFQRRMRELRDSEQPSHDSRGLSSAATRFEESSQATLEEVEAARMRRGAYEPPPDSARIERMDEVVSTPPVITLKNLLERAIADRVQELELAPTEVEPRVRFRKGGVWVPGPTYPPDQHLAVIGRLRLMAGLELKPKNVATEHQFLVPAQRAHALCTLHLEKTAHGDRALIRFAESAPLLEHPLSCLALPEEERIRVADRLAARGGGLLLITAPHARTLSTLYASLLTTLGASEERDILSLERPNERRIKGVTPINCPTEEILLASLANAAFMNPDVLGIQSIENGSILNRIINVAFRGTTTIGCFPAPDVATAMACVTASRTDPMNLMRGMIGHLHVAEYPRLCNACRQPIEVPETLPSWAREIDSPWQRRSSCKTCQGTGYQGSAWVIEYRRPSLEKADGSFETIVPRSRDIVALAVAGDIDPRDFPLLD